MSPSFFGPTTLPALSPTEPDNDREVGEGGEEDGGGEEDLKDPLLVALVVKDTALHTLYTPASPFDYPFLIIHF